MSLSLSLIPTGASSGVPKRRRPIQRAENYLLAKARTDSERAAVQLALEVLCRTTGQKLALTSPAACRDYLRLALAAREQEVFICIWLDAAHRVLAAEEAFRGTLTQTSVYPREIVKQALRRNAGAVIFAHNHPSGVAQPSHADELLTRNLREALALVDVRVLDHFIVAGAEAISFAERGLL